MSATIYPTPSAFLANVPGSILFNNRKPGWATRHRAYFESRSLQVPNLLDVNAERLRRKALDNNNIAAEALARSPRPAADAVLPMLSDMPSPNTLRRLRLRDKAEEKKEKYLARHAADAA